MKPAGEAGVVTLPGDCGLQRAGSALSARDQPHIASVGASHASGWQELAARLSDAVDISAQLIAGSESAGGKRDRGSAELTRGTWSCTCLAVCLCAFEGALGS